MTSFIERKVNEICGRWLDGFTKDNVDVSLLQAKITLSDLHFKTVGTTNSASSVLFLTLARPWGASAVFLVSR